MSKIVLSESEVLDKVFACWLGKNIGGTLGAPFEGRKPMNDLDFYRPIPDKSAANDDLDLQLVWLKLLEDKGVNPSLQDFAQYWINHLSAYPWNEYGMCRRNMEIGLRPPISGCFENYFVDEMGSPIRSEIWACVAPGDPQLAAAMAWKDAVLDHAGGEGVHGEMFWAAVESAAFVIQDPEILIQIGLAMIPVPCLISRVTREALWCKKSGVPWSDARERILTYFPSNQPCNAVPNHGFTVLGWLYGKDYGDALCKAVNCGYDTDCTGATLGALLGILGGQKAIPTTWRMPVGEEIVLHAFTGKFNSPKTMRELTDRTVAVARKVLAARSDSITLDKAASHPKDVQSLLFRNEEAIEVLRRDIHSAVATVGDLEITFHYGGDPVLLPAIAKRVEVSVTKAGSSEGAKVELKLPAGWKKENADHTSKAHAYLLTAKSVSDRNEVGVLVTAGDAKAEASFVILGPGSAKGTPAGLNVATCPKCHARKESCVCQSKG